MGKLSIFIRSGTRENDREEPAEQRQDQDQLRQRQEHRREERQRQRHQHQSRRSCGTIDGSTTLDGTGPSWCAGGGGSSAANSSALGARAATARRRPLEAATPRSGTRGRPPRAVTALETFRDETTETASASSRSSSSFSSVFSSSCSSSTTSSSSPSSSYPYSISSSSLTDSNSVAVNRRKGEVFVGGENSTPAVATTTAAAVAAAAAAAAAASSLFKFSRRSTRILSGSLLLALLAMSVLCEPALGVPAPSSPSSSSSFTGTSYDIEQHRPNGTTSRFLEFDDNYEEDEMDEPTTIPSNGGRSSRNLLGDEELEIIRRSIVESLGLRRIPDPSKANVSQTEYERAHKEYLRKVQLSQQHQEPRKRRKLHVFHATEHPGNRTRREIAEDENEILHRLFFPVEIPDEDEDSMVDHASLRFLLAGHHRSSIGNDLEIVVYLREQPEEGGASSRSPIARRTIRLDDPRDSRWLELDVTDLANAWLVEERENLGLDLEFLEGGLPTRRIFGFPVLNVFTTSSYDTSLGRRRKRGAPEQLLSLHKGRRTECRGDNKKCCRHEMTVIFKDLKGFEFIVQPKIFDAGYCKGRCPPRYNPAHHHALLQSLIWKEDRRKAPRPCCAPSKLAELEILYFDENDSTSLKVSNWKNMRVLECACS